MGLVHALLHDIQDGERRKCTEVMEQLRVRHGGGIIEETAPVMPRRKEHGQRKSLLDWIEAIPERSPVHIDAIKELIADKHARDMV